MNAVGSNIAKTPHTAHRGWSPGAVAGLLALGAWAALPQAAGADPLLAAPFRSFDAGSTPHSVASGDFDGDGKLDLAVASEGVYPDFQGAVTVLLGRGDGTFRNRADYPAGSHSRSVAIADLNGDGGLDLVVANQGSATVSVLLGTGTGSFGMRSDYATASNPSFVAIGDLNGDRKPDLVVGRGGGISVLLGNGDGTFGPRSDIATTAVQYARSVAIGDLNGDGRPDLAVANGEGVHVVSVLLGNGDGSFGPAADYATGPCPSSVAIADLDADGKPDLAVVNFGYYSPCAGSRPFEKPSITICDTVGTVTVLRGNGDGSFGASHDYSLGDYIPLSLAVGDLNGDGKPDLAVAAPYLHVGGTQSYIDYDVVAVLLGNGDATLAVSQYQDAGQIPESVVITDLDGDGKPDLAVANSFSGTVSELLGNGDGSFGAKREYLAGHPSAVVSGDLNGDGKADLVALDSIRDSVWVFLGNGDGSLGAPSRYGTDLTPVSAAIGDLNRDGKADLAVVNYASSTISVLPGNGDGTFGPGASFPTGNQPYSIAIGDLNRDGKEDLAVTINSCLYCYTPSASRSISVRLGNGDGTFGASNDYDTGSYSTSLALGDLNRDGMPDVVVANARSNDVSVLLDNGDGTLRPHSVSPAGDNPVAVAVGDLNGDGKPDLVAASAVTNTVSVLLGNGDGSFGARHEYGVGHSPCALAIKDLSGDGKPDLAVANGQDNTVSVLLGNGDGTFGVKDDYGVGHAPSSVAIADLNGDGLLDLAVGSPGSKTIAVLLNTGNGIPLPTAIEVVSCTTQPDQVDLEWFCPSMAGISASVYRRSQTTAWTAVGRTAGDGAGRLRFVDAAVQPGVRYGYRLGVGAGHFFGETWTSVPGSWTLALSPPSPNPARDRLAIGFTLASAAAARLQVLDIAGRSVAVREVGSLGAGPHQLTIPEAMRWRPGVYLVRLTQGPRSLVARTCIVR